MPALLLKKKQRQESQPGFERSAFITGEGYCLLSARSVIGTFSRNSTVEARNSTVGPVAGTEAGGSC